GRGPGRRGGRRGTRGGTRRRTGRPRRRSRRTGTSAASAAAGAGAPRCGWTSPAGTGRRSTAIRPRRPSASPGDGVVAGRAEEHVLEVAAGLAAVARVDLGDAAVRDHAAVLEDQQVR